MPTSVIEHIRRTVLPRDRADVGDGELLRCFIERRDEAALAALVKRHGPMVWGVCRRMLGHHDAEDAFQATFIVLVRKAGIIAPREMVGNWLYGVAHQTALQARRAAARRRTKEAQVVEMPDTEAVQQDRWADVQPLLDQELSRLPDHYRSVLVLSDLEGKTRKEVAAQLGCPEGTVASRLVRARSMLAKRLTRRGVTLSGGALAAALSQNLSSAVMPASVVVSTIRAANLFAAGQAVISSKVAALAEGVLKTMLLAKLKSVMAVLVVAAMVGLIGYGIAMGHQKGDAVAPQQQESEPKAQKVEDAIEKEKAEKEEATVWGKEVDSLQAGLATNAHTFRQGDTIKLTVRLRNVGKAEVTVTYSVLQAYAPRITTDANGRVSVYMPPPFDYYAVPIKRALKPGETITLYNPEVAVESEDRAKLLGEMRVDTPTICVAPGKYKIAFGGMIQSHPKLTTGTAEFEVKDQIAWGKEVGGLQAGLGLTNANHIRIGGKVEMVVKLRNVSKETIKVSSWLRWMSYARVVDARGNRVRETTAPAADFEMSPESLTLKPGETVNVGKPNLPVAALDQQVNVPEGVVNMCAIHVKPGKHKADCIGFIHEHPTLATGTVEFEVKDAKEGVTAWGKEIGGLQAGLTIGEKRAYSHGETVTLVVRVRNVGKEMVKYKYIKQYLDESPPTVTGADGKTIPQGKTGVTGLIHVPVEVRLDPGKEIVLESRIHGASGLRYELRPTNGGGKSATQDHPLHVGTGKVSIQYERVFGSSSIGRLELDPTLGKLATGKLEVEVKSDPAEKK